MSAANQEGITLAKHRKQQRGKFADRLTVPLEPGDAFCSDWPMASYTMRIAIPEEARPTPAAIAELNRYWQWERYASTRLEKGLPVKPFRESSRG